MTGSVYNNGVSESRSYNADNTLASLSYTGASIGTFAYSWDENKNKTAESITGTMSDFGFTVPSSGYDDEDRLVGWNRADSALDQSWNLSLVGDWDSFTENTTTQNRTHGDAHEILTVASQAVEHDVKGNMTLLPGVLRSGGDPLTMSWDFENKLASADVDDDQVDDIAYKWDALGRRIGRTHYFPLPPGEGQGEGSQTVIYFQSGQQTIADYPAGTAAASPTYTYVYASYIDEPVLRKGSGGDRYLHRNQQYSITALTDSGGSITERYAYTAYGELVILNAAGQPKTGTTDDNRYTYTGREWDKELNLYHFRARMYNPISGRFLKRDPMSFVDGMNLYSNYFLLAATDPSGMLIHTSLFQIMRACATSRNPHRCVADLWGKPLTRGELNFFNRQVLKKPTIATPAVASGTGIGISGAFCLKIVEGLVYVSECVEGIDPFGPTIPEIKPEGSEPPTPAPAPYPESEQTPQPTPEPPNPPAPPQPRTNCDDDWNCCLRADQTANQYWKRCIYTCRTWQTDITIIVPSFWDCPAENDNGMLPRNNNVEDGPPYFSGAVDFRRHQPTLGPSPYPKSPTCEELGR